MSYRGHVVQGDRARIGGEAHGEYRNQYKAGARRSFDKETLARVGGTVHVTQADTPRRGPQLVPSTCDLLTCVECLRLFVSKPHAHVGPLSFTKGPE